MSNVRRQKLRAFVAAVACAVVSALAMPGAFGACSAESPALTDIAKHKGNLVRGPLTVQEIEREHELRMPESGKVLPFGYANAQWQQFKQAMKPQDEIYFVSRSEGRFYMDGYVLVRGGCAIRHLLGSIS